MHGWIDGWMDGWTRGWMKDGRMDGRMDGWMHRRTGGWVHRWRCEMMLGATVQCCSKRFRDARSLVYTICTKTSAHRAGSSRTAAAPQLRSSCHALAVVTNSDEGPAFELCNQARLRFLSVPNLPVGWSLLITPVCSNHLPFVKL